ncbi:hypothetical protein [Mesorhizobium sp.]|uniref:hypothetical protein n=1 Tax=Mesorhizobium sp. TaxID=1871066 RepID=UPI000FE8C7B2|nr:hypothetical protein [Mesorhizobium sp.]RWM25794.1 MAG: hypothetical protein EOR74_17300 [Mesorhizobium sp.]RWM36653.1 MAG: hypothetical protein EOR75_21645 [Mesorhizobium sp.]TIO72744.1 MAG: hypothetical protein E5X75_31310 [Mesorhizobium sp.]TIO87070.1 MAG: hypothetical protein E5X74_03715 [Mesorhizobium sp.]TJV49762.1 MAG: hypothetical protein E5Y01_22185 [Mesorhizobium sp.]
MSDSPEKRNEWRAILYVQARVAVLFVPILLSLLLIGVIAGNERKSVPDGIDRTVTSSVK